MQGDATMAGPLVSVLTPVYNGEAFIGECIESVLTQTYRNFEYVLVDNASTDRTAEILAKYGAADARIRIHTNERLVPVVQNHNVAVAHMSPAATWCKFVSADDALFPECLEQMVALGSQYPSVGLIGAYQVQGSRVAHGGLPYPSAMTPGRRIARLSLLGRLAVVGPPTAHMLRADLVRARQPFYDESTIHADEAACYDILTTADFGFVHQVLTYQRVHRGTITHSTARRLNTYLLGHMKILMRYGPMFLAPDELAHTIEERMDAYYTFLARALLSPARREIWRYHTDGLRQLGLHVDRARLARASGRQLRRAALAPGNYLPKLVRLVRPRQGSDVAWREWWAPTGFEAIKSVRPADRDAA
jgi:glycosyltransferase involved in cell wall biosynthesis